MVVINMLRNWLQQRQQRRQQHEQKIISFALQQSIEYLNDKEDLSEWIIPILQSLPRHPVKVKILTESFLTINDQSLLGWLHHLEWAGFVVTDRPRPGVKLSRQEMREMPKNLDLDSFHKYVAPLSTDPIQESNHIFISPLGESLCHVSDQLRLFGTTNGMLREKYEQVLSDWL